ncbi:MAG: hypothetical protein RLZ12_12 [Bacillota bacterium]|jgi:dTDP-4-amino-4,6-dideoxygalactose transaminase
MHVPLINISAQDGPLQAEFAAAIKETINSGRYILGPLVKLLEEEVADYTGVKHAIGVANGTDALVLSLHALGVSYGDEVITTPFTFFATAGAISRLGAVPVFVDIDPTTYNIDVTKIAERITAKTKAIVPVHLFGQPVNMEALLTLAKQHNLKVVVDAAQAFGARCQDQPIGVHGDTTTFSFFPTKNLGCYGDGGMIVTNDDQVAETVRMLRVQGRNPKDRKYYHQMTGYNSRLDELQAGILRIKLQHIDHWNNKRRAAAQVYHAKLQDLPLTLPSAAPYATHIYHLYVIKSTNRDQLQAFLKERGVQTEVYYPLPLHLQQAYQDLNYNPGDFPHAERAAQQVLALPMHPELSEEQIIYVQNMLNDFFQTNNN